MTSEPLAALVWLGPIVKERLLPLLPQNEEKRHSILPWVPNSWTHDNPAKRIRPGFVNQRLHEQYCPLLFLGLQMLAPGIVDWEDRTYIEFCLKEVKPNEKGHLDLPDGLDLEP